MDSATADARLHDAVRAANIPTLLMVLVQLTGDLRWIRAPYRPTAARGVDDNDSGGLPESVQAEVRTEAAAAIRRWRGGEAIRLPKPSPELLVEMLSVSMGEQVPDEYGPMLAAELGAGTDPCPGVSEPSEDLDAIVIGAGVSGLIAAVRLRQAGVGCTILERRPDLGGTWLDNRYPAAAVDTPSHLYSFSFARNDWPRYFASREQIHDYLGAVAQDFGVRGHIRFGVQVQSDTQDPGDQRAGAVRGRCLSHRAVAGRCGRHG
jgi:4-hydroxyacetophenone monooxygenase